MKRIVVHAKKCTGCRLCESICAMYNEGVDDVSRARIHVVRDHAWGLSTPVLCYQCGKPPCINVCPADAIHKDEETGMVQIDYDECIACGLCASECPFGAIIQLENKVIKCELCGGDPQCVKYCETKAIEYVDSHRAYQSRRLSHGEKVLKEVKGALRLP